MICMNNTHGGKLHQTLHYTEVFPCLCEVLLSRLCAQIQIFWVAEYYHSVQFAISIEGYNKKEKCITQNIIVKAKGKQNLE